MNKALSSAFVFALLAGTSQGQIVQEWIQPLSRFTPARIVTRADGTIVVFGTQHAPTTTTGDMAIRTYSQQGVLVWEWASGNAADESLSDATIDSQGNFILAGNLGERWHVLKLSADRQQLWGTTYVPDGSTIAHDAVYRVLADATGSVYVAGYTQGPITEDARVTKFSATGAVLWSQSRGIEERWDRFQDMAIDPQGNVVVVGEVGDSNLDEQLKFCVASFTPAGATRWSRYFLGVWPPDQQGFFEGGDARAVSIDAAGNVYAAGVVTDDLLFNDIFLTKITPTGSVAWKRQWEGSTALNNSDYGLYERAYGMTLGPGGRAYLTGETFNNTGWNYFDIPVIAYDANGTNLWSNVFNGGDTSNDSEDVSLNVMVDEFGRIVMIGSDWTKPGNDYIVRVLADDGTILNHSAVDVPNYSFDIDRPGAATIVPGGRLAFVGMGGGFGPLGPRTAIVGLLDLGTPATHCHADLDDGTSTGTPDGAITIDDLLFFLNSFEGGAVSADLDNGTSTGTPDGAVTVDDLLFFLVRFEAGC